MEQLSIVENIRDKAVYFTKISENDRKRVEKWLKTQEGKTIKEKNFLKMVDNSLCEVDYDYWIANLEPSVAEGKIFYAENNKVGIGFSCNDWERMATEYAPERGSRLAKVYELFIWYAIRIIDGYWTLEYVANDSSSAGNYWNAPGALHNFENSGARICGGYADGQGNTYRIVTDKNGFVLVGGIFLTEGTLYTVATIHHLDVPSAPRRNGAGVLVLTK